MKRLIRGGLFLIPTLFLWAAQPRSTEPSRPWVLSTLCDGRFQTRVTVGIDSRVVWSGSLKVCRAPRNALEGARISFTFVADSEGISESDYREKNQQFSGNLWLAGAEADGVALGVSMTAPNGASLNSVHFAEATQATKVKHAPRVWVSATPWLRK